MHENKLVVGTAQFGMNYGVSNQKGRTGIEEVHVILETMKRKNIFELDTAKNYGNSEEVLGTYFKNNPYPKWKVTTKISEIKNSIFYQLADSEKKLYIRPYTLLAHNVKIYQTSIFELSSKELKEKKIIKKIGVSIYNEEELKKVINSSFAPDIIQLPMNILDTRLFRKGIIDKISNMGIEVHVRSVFLQGLFYLPNEIIKKDFRDAYSSLEKLKEISRNEELSLPELSLLWLLNMNQISKIIIGINNLFQLRSHLDTLTKKLSKSVVDQALSVIYENEKILNPSLWKS